jgi:hypothetical protein
LEAQLKRTFAALELSGDVLLGARAPSFGRSPLRAALVARHPLGAGFELTAILATLLSARPALREGADYAPFEPRVQALVGARYSYARVSSPPRSAAPREPPIPKQTEPEPTSQPELAKLEGSLLVHVVNARGEALPDVRVLLEPGEELRTGGAGTARFTGLAAGERALSIRADGFVVQELKAQITDAATTELEVVLEVAVQESVLRVLVRDAERGTPLAAQLIISPVGASRVKRVQATTASDGSFERSLPAGRYSIALRANGYRGQTRAIEVLEHGVTLFNVDLTPVAR